MVFIYLENYCEAYNDLIVAHNIDQSLKANIHAESIINMISNAYKLIKFQVNSRLSSVT